MTAYFCKGIGAKSTPMPLRFQFIRKSGKYTRFVSPSTAQREKWLGVAVTVLLPLSTTLLGSFTHRLPFQ